MYSNADGFKTYQWVLVDILSDGKLITHRRYGPIAWSAVCYSNRFVTQDFSDGFDSLSFKNFYPPH